VDVVSDRRTCTAFKLYLAFTPQCNDKLGREGKWRRQYTEYETCKIVICGVFLSVFMAVYLARLHTYVDYNIVSEIDIGYLI